MFRRIVRFLTPVLVFGLVLSAVGRPAWAQVETVNPAVANPSENEVVLPRFISGDSVVIDGEHAGSVFAAAASITVDAPVGGDLVAAGASVIVNAPIGQDIYAAGSTVIIDAPVNGNVVLVGAEVQFRDGAQVKGSVITAGESLQFLGSVAGQIMAAGNQAVFDGSVGQDAWFAGEKLEVSSAASIGGNLKAQVSSESVSQEASVAGTTDISHEQPDFDRWRRNLEVFQPAATVGGAIYSFLWKSVLLLAVIFFTPGLIQTGTQVIRQQGQLAVMGGMMAVVGIPLGAILLLVSVVGAPVAIAIFLAYLFLMLTVWIFPTFWLGQKILPNENLYLQAILGTVVVVVLSMLPVVGVLVKLLLFTIGLGTVVLLVRRQMSGS